MIGRVTVTICMISRWGAKDIFASSSIREKDTMTRTATKAINGNIVSQLMMRTHLPFTKCLPTVSKCKNFHGWKATWCRNTYRRCNVNKRWIIRCVYNEFLFSIAFEQFLTFNFIVRFSLLSVYGVYVDKTVCISLGGENWTEFHARTLSNNDLFSRSGSLNGGNLLARERIHVRSQFRNGIIVAEFAAYLKSEITRCLDFRVACHRKGKTGRWYALVHQWT